MALAFSPNGVDPEAKMRAEDAELRLQTATLALGVLAAATAIAIPVLAPGFTLAAALCPALKHRFTRIKKDPPRSDFALPVTAAPPRSNPP